MKHRNAKQAVRKPNAIINAANESIPASATNAKPISGPAPATNCTRVCSAIHGLREHVTFRDHEAERLGAYIAVKKSEGFVVTTERGVWME